MQSAFFFLYNGTVCLAFFLMLGTVGWRSSLSFVRHIYRCYPAPSHHRGLQPTMQCHRPSLLGSEPAQTCVGQSARLTLSCAESQMVLHEHHASIMQCP